MEIKAALSQISGFRRKHGKKGIHIVSAQMDLKNMIVTIDAMGCQKKITEKIQGILFDEDYF